jgi:hypothetical protein
MTKQATAKKTSAARRTPTGPKPGSARSNQTAVLSNPDRIKSVVSARGGGGIFVEAEGGKSMMIAQWQQDKLTSGTSKSGLAVVGKSFKALADHVATIPKPGAKLARGVDSHNSPHSTKAVADNRREEGKRNGSAGRKARGDAAAVAGKKAAKKANGGTRGLAKAPVKITGLVKVKDAGLAVGSGREAKLAFALKCKTTADFLGQTVTDSNGKEHKCDAGALSGMVKRGHVRLG